MYEKFDAVIFDATGFTETSDLNQLYYFFNPIMRKIQQNGRVVVMGRPHMQAKTGEQASAQRALEGFTRSAAKEIGKKSSTAQTILVEEGAEKHLDQSFPSVLSAKPPYAHRRPIISRKATRHEYPDRPNRRTAKFPLASGASREFGGRMHVPSPVTAQR